MRSRRWARRPATRSSRRRAGPRLAGGRDLALRRRGRHGSDLVFRGAGVRFHRTAAPRASAHRREDHSNSAYEYSERLAEIDCTRHRYRILRTRPITIWPAGRRRRTSAGWAQLVGGAGLGLRADEESVCRHAADPSGATYERYVDSGRRGAARSPNGPYAPRVGTRGAGRSGRSSGAAKSLSVTSIGFVEKPDAVGRPCPNCRRQRALLHRGGPRRMAQCSHWPREPSILARRLAESCPSLGGNEPAPRSRQR